MRLRAFGLVLILIPLLCVRIMGQVSAKNLTLHAPQSDPSSWTRQNSNDGFHPKSQRTAPSAPYLPFALRTSHQGRQQLSRWWMDVPEDSTTHVIWNGQKALLSYDFVSRLSQKQGWRHNLGKGSARLEWGKDLSQNSGIPLVMGSPMEAMYFPNDKWLVGSPQWALSNPGNPIADIPGIKNYDIHMPQVWDQWGGSDSLIIAVVDAGFNFRHPDLQNRWFVNQVEAKGKPNVDDDGNGYVDDSLGWDFVENDNDPKDGNGHGTEVSSIIVASFDNELGIAGMLPEAHVLPVRVLDASGHGELADIAGGIEYAVNMGASVINFSIGGSADSPALKAAFQLARDRGVPIIVAAGNEANNLDVNTPAPFNYGFENVISVAAVNHGGQFCAFSNYGKKTVDLAAPGEWVLTCGVANKMDVWKDDFESPTLQWTPTSANDFKLSTTNPIQGKQSLDWAATTNTSLTLNDTVDLIGKYGCNVWFQVQFTPGNIGDAFILEALIVGESRWRTVGVLGGAKLDQWCNFGLTGLDGKRIRMRFRTSASGSVITRKLKLDMFTISCLNPAAADTESYPVVAGTSIAAPHVSAYVALLKLACDRMGLPLTKDKIWAGTDADTACANRTLSGGHLNVAKGLAFYLETLPSLQVIDSTQKTWVKGKKVAYTLRVSNGDGDWIFSSSQVPEGGTLTAKTGDLVWNNGIPEVKTIDIALKAEGITTLRRRLAFQVVEEDLPVSIHSLPAEFKRRRMSLLRPIDPSPDWILGRRVDRHGPPFPQKRP